MFSTTKNGSTTLLIADTFENSITVNTFDPNYLEHNHLVIDRKRGRATTYFFKLMSQTAVLRHYWRGGLIGKLLSDQYFYLGLKHTRTVKEFTLLTQLANLNLPVPEAIAAKVVRSGLIYRGDIITKALPLANSVLDILKKRKLSEKEIHQVGETIAQFHIAGVNHADLNINNILFSEDQVFLIDFDRGTKGCFDSKVNKNNMQRLARSFEKERKRNTLFHWLDADWQLLEKSYKQAIEKRL